MIFPKIISHRGTSRVAPENTMAAFRSALELKIDGIETDVQLTRDGHVVICHDEMLNRTTDGEGLLCKYTLDELKALSAGSWFSEEFKDEKIPTFIEFLELVADRQILINIEIKSGIVMYPGIEKKVIDMINEYGIGDRVIISSFNHYSLVECKKIDASIKTGILYIAGIYEPWDYAKKVGADALHPLLYNIRREIMEGAKKNNVLVNPFTVNDLNQMRNMVAMEVDGIITDLPDVLIKLREDMEGK